MSKLLIPDSQWNNEPPSPWTSLDDPIDMGYVGEGSVIRDQMSTIDGPHCYVYV